MTFSREPIRFPQANSICGSHVPSSSPGYNSQNSQRARNSRVSPGLNAPSSQETYSERQESMNQRHPSSGPVFNQKNVQTFNAGCNLGNVQGTYFREPVSMYPSRPHIPTSIYIPPDLTTTFQVQVLTPTFEIHPSRRGPLHPTSTTNSAAATACASFPQPRPVP